MLARSVTFSGLAEFCVLTPLKKDMQMGCAAHGMGQTMIEGLHEVPPLMTVRRSAICHTDDAHIASDTTVSISVFG